MAKGKKTGGRVRGVPNKATAERALIAAQQHADSVRAGKKLAKDVLDEFMHLTAGMAAVYQPLPPGVTVVEQGREPNPEKFWKCVEMVRDFAKELAKYQSPTFKAIAVHAPIDGAGARDITPRLDASNVIDLTDVQAITRIYKRRVGGVHG